MAGQQVTQYIDTFAVQCRIAEKFEEYTLHSDAMIVFKQNKNTKKV